ncbi:MAG: mechanosensitive ion channel [Phycisphaerales bacterium]|nr:mechanosensitive ion channel [Phycisphaerales bacterium]MCB9863136.1 mechanosensitive ion channel [Phycisphaerales bacterium]
MISFRVYIAACCLIATSLCGAQSRAPNASAIDIESNDNTDIASGLPEKVAVEPVAEDDAIDARLTEILKATEWFESPEVTVDKGIVFLSGATALQQHKDWAGRLAGRTQDVVGVVNRISVREPPIWDLRPARLELVSIAKEFTRALPLFFLGCVLLIVTWIAAKYASRLSRSAFRRRIKSELLNNVVGYVVALPVFLLGTYLVLRITGLTRLAATVIGGTGLLGLIIGIAFRDIAENFLASILISMRRPFNMGDLIEVAAQKGFVQHVSTRGTLLMTLDGNHVKIPNSTIYKETIVNFTANPNVRMAMIVGIGFDSSIALAQEIALKVLSDHDAVLADPEPLVLVEELGAATVNLRLYFWVDGHKHSAVKVKSAVIRLVKRAFDRRGISMPDEAREVVFPDGIDVRVAHSRKPAASETPGENSADESQGAAAVEPEASAAEGNLDSEADEIRKQAEQSRLPADGENLIGPDLPEIRHEK